MHSGLWFELGIVEPDHIALVVPSIENYIPILRRLDWKGGEFIFKQPKLGRNLTNLSHPDCAMRLELLEPSGEDSYLWPFLRKYGSRVQHHITYYVEDLQKAREVLEEKGFRLFFDRPNEFFIHPDSAGTLIQFFQRRTRTRMLVWRARWMLSRYRTIVRVAVIVLAALAFVLWRKRVSSV